MSEGNTHYYGVKASGTGFVAALPLITKAEGYTKKYFGKWKHDDPQLAAAIWLEVEGIKLWGKRRWTMIKNGHLHTLRGNNFGVWVRILDNNSSGTSYLTVVVEWRVNTQNMSMCFSPSRYGGDIDTAEQAANLYACKKRAELTGGELNLPRFFYEQLHGHNSPLAYV